MFFCLLFITNALTALSQGDSWTQKSDIGYNAVNVPEPIPRAGAAGFSIDGKGYIGTGYNTTWSNSHDFKDFWEYDPATNTWTQKADFGGTARRGAVGFSIGSKGYLGTGGYYGKDFWEYNPATNAWTQKADFGGTARSGAVGFSISNKGYLGTGGYPYTKDFWEYDPATDKWTQKADFGGTARSAAIGFSIGSKGYIGTGYDGFGICKDFWEYDLLTDNWTQKADFGGTGRYQAVGFSISNKGYVGTGLNESYSYTKDFWEYDPSTGNWTQKADFGGDGDGRSEAVGFGIGSKGYIGTGAFWDPGNFKDFWEYDTSTGNWTQKADFGGAPRGGAVGFSIGDKGYIGTGSSGYLNFFKDFWEYDPATNTWTQKADFKGSARSDAVGFSISGKGYLGTGRTVDGYSGDFWEYDPLADTWTKKNDFTGGARWDAIGFCIGNKGYLGMGMNGGWFPAGDFWEYDPATDTWLPKANLYGYNPSPVGFSIGSKGYFGTGASEDFWEYDPSTDKWTQKADFGGPFRENAVGFSIGAKGYLGTGFFYDFSGITQFNYCKDFWEYTPEVCNGLTVYEDADNDGYGDISKSLFVADCIVPKGYIKDSTDCNDANAAVHPGACDPINGIDDNCDGIIDDGYGTTSYYKDLDGDGYGSGNATLFCSNPGAGYSINNSDCNDASASVHPGAIEICHNGIDDNCNGQIDEACLCPVPVNLKVIKISDTCARLIWKMPDPSVHYVRVVYRPVGGSEWKTERKKSVNNGIYISGLIPNTTYEWKMRNICANDRSDWVTGPNFTTLSSTAFSSIAATVNGNKLQDNVSLQIMPNPNKGSFTLQMHLPEKAASTTLTLYNNLGAKVWEQKAGMLSGSVRRNISLENKLSAGVYIMVVQQNEFRLKQKVFVVK